MEHFTTSDKYWQSLPPVLNALVFNSSVNSDVTHYISYIFHLHHFIRVRLDYRGKQKSGFPFYLVWLSPLQFTLCSPGVLKARPCAPVGYHLVDMVNTKTTQASRSGIPEFTVVPYFCRFFLVCCTRLILFRRRLNHNKCLIVNNT